MTDSRTVITPPIGIAVGPAGRAMAEQMEREVLLATQQHLNMERQAHTAYFAAAIWFAERELRGFAHYYRQEALDELDHAARFGDYLISRGQTVELQPLDAPCQSWVSPEDVLVQAFRMESDVTTSLHQIYALAEQSSDMRTTVFLDPMLEKQTRAEHEAAYLLGRVRLADQQAAAILLVDDELGRGQSTPAQLSSGNTLISS